ncbi:hypothetical protein PENTCL1PPCAC_25723, partial [Pristionchus entomophagus]
MSFILSALNLLRHFIAYRFLGPVIRLLSKMSRMLLPFLIIFTVFWLTYAITVLSITGETMGITEIPWKLFENGAFEIFADFREGMREG